MLMIMLTHVCPCRCKNVFISLLLCTDTAGPRRSPARDWWRLGESGLDGVLTGSGPEWQLVRAQVFVSKRSVGSAYKRRQGPDCHWGLWGARFLWFIINYTVSGPSCSVCVRIEPSVKHTGADTHCSPFWPPSGKTSAPRTRARSHGTPKQTKKT